MKSQTTAGGAAQAPVQAAPCSLGDSGRLAMLLTHDEPGGARNLWEQLADGLRSSGLSVQLHCLYDKREGSTSGWQAVLPQPLSTPGFIQAVRATARRLRECGARATLSAQPAANIIGALAGWMAGVPCRITSHHTPLNTYTPMLRWLDLLVGCTPAVHRVVCVSEGVRLSTLQYPAIYQRKVVVVRNALAPSAAQLIQPLHRVREHLPRDRPVRIVAAGRLAEQKNYPVLIRAMQHVQGAELHVLGEGPDRPAIEQLINQLNLHERVQLLGHRSHAEALAHMAECDIFVQPSLFEGHSVALLEAAALGLPLVVSDAPTQLEALKGADGVMCGAVAPVHDHEALARELNALCSDESRFREAAALARRLAAESSFERFVRDYLQLRPAVKA